MENSTTGFWEQYLAGLPPETKSSRIGFTAWSFGNSPEMAARLGRLVLAGVKTATASLLWEYETSGEALPAPGDFSIILDGNGNPLGIIETLEVEIKPFNRVDERFAFDEGEGDRTLDYWRSVHRGFFGQSCAALNRTPAEDMPVVCERFRLVFPKDPEGG